MSHTSDTPPRPAERTARVGLVSDTHGVFHPELQKVLPGVDVILHAGDVGSRTVLDHLEHIAPTRAVMGNVDGIVPNLDLPLFARFATHGVRMLVTHYAGDPERLLAPVEGELAREPADVVVSGHTHQPALRVHGRRLFINPGSAGARRFGLPASCALLTLAPRNPGTRVEARVLNLDEGGVLVQEKLTFSDG